ncbi:hypothetical protein PanWU01x14_017040, partial [Parasponia andersonii]
DPRPPLLLVKDNAIPPNIDVHNLRIALDALVGWDDILMDGYHRSPFNKDVRATLLPVRFKHLTINTFDGKTDPQDHMDHFNDLMDLYQVDDLAHFRFFAVTLIGAIKNLSAIHQGLEETLQSYLNYFTSELVKVTNAPERGVLTLMMAKVQPETKLWEELLEREYKTLKDFYQRVCWHLSMESSHINLYKIKRKGRKERTKDATITTNNNKKSKKGRISNQLKNYLSSRSRRFQGLPYD